MELRCDFCGGTRPVPTYDVELEGLYLTFCGPTCFEMWYNITRNPTHPINA